MNDELRARWGHLFANISDVDIDALRYGKPQAIRWPQGEEAAEQLAQTMMAVWAFHHGPVGAETFWNHFAAVILARLAKEVTE